MFSGEKIGGTGEVSGEDLRKVNEVRGEKTIEADEARRKELLERREALMARARELEARIKAREAKEGLGEAISDLDKIAEGGSSEATGAEVVEEVETNGEPGAEVEEIEVDEETGSEVVEEAGERPSEEEVRGTAEKAKKKKALSNYIVGIGMIALSGAILASAFMSRGANKEEEVPQGNSVKLEDVVENDVGGETMEAEKGIYDGYGEAGMWLSENKSGPYAFADAREVAEVCDNDEVEMIKYTAHNQVESFADYMANLPEELQPEGFKGLNLRDTEAKLESLSPEDFTALEATFGVIMDEALTRRVTLDGSYDNAYMALKDPNGAATHENMEIVRCATNESNLEVTEFYWLDANGNEIGSMTVKMSPVYNEEGEIVSYELCEQVVNKQGTSTIYEGIPEVTPETPSTPTPETPVPVTPVPETPTPETPTPETPTPETPTPETPTPETPTPETPAPKDAENMTRIDEQIHQDIAEDIGTEQVVVHQETAAPENITEKPAAEAYQGTEATIVENEAAPAAEPVQEQISQENNYSENRGGANAGEYAPVQENQAAQAEADASAIPVSEAPTGGQELTDILGDLGIN